MPQRVFDLYRHLEEGGERTDAMGPRTNASLEAWKKHKGEMDAWRWNEYWVRLDVVIEFKRDVYQLALTELARFLPKVTHHPNRYLRGSVRPHGRDGRDARRDADNPAEGGCPGAGALSGSAQDEVVPVDQLGAVGVPQQTGDL